MIVISQPSYSNITLTLTLILILTLTLTRLHTLVCPAGLYVFMIPVPDAD
jgi:hypothetical protein